MYTSDQGSLLLSTAPRPEPMIWSPKDGLYLEDEMQEVDDLQAKSLEQSVAITNDQNLGMSPNIPGGALVR